MKNKSFAIELSQEDLNDKNKMEALNEVMSQHQDEICNYIVKLSQELNVSNKYASAIWYLRTRSRWTQELEDKLVQMCKDNEPVPNMCDWP